jgi:hypothetical protein
MDSSGTTLFPCPYGISGTCLSPLPSPLPPPLLEAGSNNIFLPRECWGLATAKCISALQAGSYPKKELEVETVTVPIFQAGSLRPREVKGLSFLGSHSPGSH